VPMLRDFGFEVLTVPAQDVQNGRFPTVESPNPENGPALQMAIDLANESGAEIVVGTDPDADRMGVAVRDAAGKMVLLTGNQIGSLMAWYRLKTCFDLGWLTSANRSRAVLVKTFVTTELQRSIADAFGVNVVDTVTGFKYIAGKLRKYEEAIPADKKGDYRSLSEEQTRALRLEYSRFFVFGGEESYGYMVGDFVRDKDALTSALIFCDLAAEAKEQGSSVMQELMKLYQRHGLYHEHLVSLTKKGKNGAEEIERMMQQYRENPPKTLGGAKVVALKDLQTGVSHDLATGAQSAINLPGSNVLQFFTESGSKISARPSGTEPKIKFYFSVQAPWNETLDYAAQVEALERHIGKMAADLGV